MNRGTARTRKKSQRLGVNIRQQTRHFTQGLLECSQNADGSLFKEDIKGKFMSDHEPCGLLKANKDYFL